MTDLMNLGKRAKAASRMLAAAPREQKDRALLAIADALMNEQDAILEANREDVQAGAQNGLSEALIDRLTLSAPRLAAIAADTRRIADLPDPVGLEFDSQALPNGLRVRKRRTPIGVLGVIYEARPNVTVDVAALALKSGNAAILRGGKETLRSNIAMIAAIQQGLAEVDLPGDAILYIDDPDRALVLELLRLDAYVDMIIPRGGAGLHRFCRENATIPVITGGIGICHLFVDASADLDRAIEIIHNAKTQRPSVCNSLDTALIHRDVAAYILPRLVERLGPDGVCFKADADSYQALGARAEVEPAGPEDWDIEWLSLVLGLKVVDGLEEAIQHIQNHSTGHSDGILTRTEDHATTFVDTVDSSVVYVNASTRFTDGSQLGLGAEVAVSTQKLHARGPMALQELTSYKWIVIGEGQIRE